MNLTQDQINYLRKCHPQIAMPCYAGQLFESVMVSMMKFVIYCGKLGMNFSLDTMVNESLITRGRNNLVAKFMHNTAATHIMWIDSDIGFQPEDIFKLLLHDKDVVGGLYPKKTLPIDYVVNVNPEAVNEKGQISTINGLIPVSRLGTGFMMIKRQVFDKMFAAYPQTKYIGNIGLDKCYDPFMYALFDCVINPDTHEYNSEDWTFCDRFRAIGGECWVDPSILLSHSGFFRYPGRPEDIAKMFGGADEKGMVSFNSTPRIAIRQDILKTGAAAALNPTVNISIPTGPVLTIPAPKSILPVQPEQVTKAIDINEAFAEETVVK